MVLQSLLFEKVKYRNCGGKKNDYMATYICKTLFSEELLFYVRLASGILYLQQDL